MTVLLVRVVTALACLVPLLVAGPAQAAVSPDGPPQPYGRPGEDGLFVFDRLLPVGDVDGNGVRDVVEQRRPSSVDPGAHTVGLIARDGRGGGELWRRTVAVGASEALAVLAYRQPRSNRPMVLLRLVGPASPGSSEDLRLRLFGLDATSNTIAWRATFREVQTTGPDGSLLCSPCTRPVGLVAAPRGAGQDLLVQQVRTRGTGRPGASPQSDVQLQRVDGATGRLSSVGAPFRSDASLPDTVVTADLDGDRREDVLSMSPDVGRSLTALSGATGQVLWRSGRIPLRCCRYVSRVHADAQGRVDLLVSTFAGETVDDYAQRPVYTDREVTLLDGRTGQVRWRRPGVDAQPVGLVAGAPVVAVLTRTVQSGPTTSSTATVTTYDRVGAPLWRHDVTIRSTDRNVELAGEAAVRGGLDDAADADGDGYRDLVLRHLLGNVEEGDAHVVELLSGASGRVLTGLPLEARPVLAGLRGQQADVLTTRVARGRNLEVVGLDGAGGRVLWRTSLPSSTDLRYALTDSVRLHSSGCRSLLVTGGPKQVSAVLTSAGALAWAVRPSSGSLFGGTLVRGTRSPGTCA